MSRIGEAIRAECRAAGMTSNGLAEIVTLTPQYVRLIWCGGAIPSMETVLKIANVFPDVDPAAWCWLLLRDLWGEPIADLMKRHARAGDGG
jgi:transcriptional regulator with XRE-family HTH domain